MQGTTSIRLRLAATASAATLLAPGLLAQGADDCANATPISGLGVFNIDNSGASNDGNADCNGKITHKDVWWRWSPAQTGDYKVTLCGGVNFQSRMVVYDGTACYTAPLVDCAAANCTFQSFVNFHAVQGQEYLLRMGGRNAFSSGSGTFEIKEDPCPTAVDDAFEENDTCDQALQLTDGTYTDLFVSKTDDDFYKLEVPTGGQLVIDVTFTHADGDLDIFLYDACGGSQLEVGGSATDDENITWDNDTGGDACVYLEVDHWGPDPNSDCNNYDLTITGTQDTGLCPPGGGGEIGTNFCSSTPNSSGGPAVMDAEGSKSVSANDLTLVAETVPDQPGLFFYSLGQIAGGSGTPFGNGLLCVGGGGNPVIRLPIVVGQGNRLEHLVDNTNPPVGHGQITAGSTWNFQAWFRDPAAGGAAFDLSDGYEITFTP